MSGEAPFKRVVVALHDATLDDSRWPAAAALLDAVCGMRGSALVVGKGHSHIDGEIYWVRFCSDGKHVPDGEQRYFGNYYARDERVPRLAKLPDSRLVPTVDLYTPQERKTSAAFNEGLPVGGYQNGLNVRLEGPNGSSIVWCLTDSTEPDGWSSAQVKRVRGLLPHIRQFVRVRQTLAAADGLGRSLASLLEATRVAIIHLDRRGRIVATNDRASDVLRKADGLLDHGRCLRAGMPEDDLRLCELLARALPVSGGLPASGSMTVRRVSGSVGLAVHVLPVGNGSTVVASDGTAALVVVDDPRFRPEIDHRLVASALGLTAAEGRAAAAVAAGDSVRDIAVATRRQENSVRFLLKSIYKKHGISRQSELVRLVLPLAELTNSRR